MLTNIDQCIEELLYNHDCVIIPNFGGLIVNKTSTKINESTGTVYPPNKQILFNSSLKVNDGLLMNYVKVKNGISVVESKKIIFSYSQKILRILDNEKSFRIENVGVFIIGEENKIIFRQDDSNNFDLNSFGFDSLKVQKVTNKNKILDINFKENTNRKNLTLRAVAVLLPLIILSVSNIIIDTNKDYFNIQKSELNLLSTIFKTNKNEKELVRETSYQKSHLQKINNCYIIAGAFLEKKNAEMLMRDLKNLNFDSKILKSKNGYHRVTYCSFENKQKAIVELKRIKLINKSAWILSI